MFRYEYKNSHIYIHQLKPVLVCIAPIENIPLYCVDTNSVSFLLSYENLESFLYDMKLSGLAVEIKLSFNEPFCVNNPIYVTLYNVFPLK
jgi:hypothetical protein